VFQVVDCVAYAVKRYHRLMSSDDADPWNSILQGLLQERSPSLKEGVRRKGRSARLKIHPKNRIGRVESLRSHVPLPGPLHGTEISRRRRTYHVWL